MKADRMGILVIIGGKEDKNNKCVILKKKVQVMQ